MEPKAPKHRTSIFGDHPIDTPESRGGGEGMDRKIQRSTWTTRRLALAAGILLFVLAVGYGFLTTTGGKKLNVEREKLTISTVHEGDFQELISVNGSVLPLTTVYLDAIEGGRIEEVFVEEGAMVTAGQPILRLSNSNLQLQLVQAEAQRIEQDNLLQNLRFQLEQNSLNLRQQLTEMDYQIQRLGRLDERNRELYEKQLISEQQYEQVRDELEYWQRRRALTLQGYQTDSLRQVTEITRMRAALSRMQQNFQVVEQSLDNLTVRAPVTGQLSMLNAEVGEIRSQGFRFGQIDVLDGFKVRAAIDEFYITRVARGQTGRGELSGEAYTMTVTRVFPEVRDGRFEVDLEFSGQPPAGIRRGQTLRFRLEMSDPSRAVLVPRGGFYQTTGGNWIYVVDGSGEIATKRFIRLGRQNPTHYEVLDGLEPGEEVITSSYETFGDADQLVLK